MISRRTLVSSVISIASCTLAGCSSNESEPTGDAGAEGDSSEQSSESEDYQQDSSDNGDSSPYEQFEATIVDQGINVVDGGYDSDERVAEIRYVPQSGDQNVLADEIGGMSGTFFRHVDDGWDATRLEGRMLDTDESPIAEWYALVEWYDDFQSDDITANELSIQVLDTVEPV